MDQLPPDRLHQADVRLEFWEEMDLNQFLYMNGEVGKTFRAPQGPDSGYQLYLNGGKRRCYFDTTAVAHAKDEPAYIVEAYPPARASSTTACPSSRSTSPTTTTTNANSAATPA